MKKQIISAIMSVVLVFCCVGGAAWATNSLETYTVDVAYQTERGTSQNYNAIISFEITNVLSGREYTLGFDQNGRLHGEFEFTRFDKIVTQSPCVITYKGVKESRGDALRFSPLWIQSLDVTPELFNSLSDGKVGEGGGYFNEDSNEWVDVIDGLIWNYVGKTMERETLEAGKSVSLQSGYYILGFDSRGMSSFGYIEVIDSGTLPQVPPTAAISVILDNRPLTFDVSPQIVNGRTMVPMRAIFEALGATVVWDGATQTAIAKKGETEVSLTLGSLTPTVNGQIVTIDQPGVVIGGRMLVPLRFVAEAFGVTVDWDPATRIVNIKS